MADHAAVVSRSDALSGGPRHWYTDGVMLAAPAAQNATPRHAAHHMWKIQF